MSRNYFDDLGDRLVRLDGVGIEFGIGDEPHPSGMSTGKLARILYFGTATIPPRDYFEDAIVALEVKLPRLFARVMKAVTKGESPLRALTAAAEVAEEAMRRSIDRYNAVPNARSTIEKKGFNDPLMHFGNLIAAVRAEVVDDAGGDADFVELP